MPDIGLFPAQPATGDLVLPRARDIRLIFSAAAPAPDPQLQYWGSSAALIGQTLEVLTGAYGSDERGHFCARYRGESHSRHHAATRSGSVEQSGRRALAARPERHGDFGCGDAPCPGALAQRLQADLLRPAGRAGGVRMFGGTAPLAFSRTRRAYVRGEDGALPSLADRITLDLARDWSWGALGAASFEVRNTANQLVGSIDLTESVSVTALQNPDRSTTRLIFFDAVDPKPATGHFPAKLNLSYQVTPIFNAPAAQQDPPLVLPLSLPIAANPLQTPQLASAGYALSPYSPAPDYSATSPRQRALWLEFATPVTDPDDIYFARVLSYAPDQMLTGAPFINPGESIPRRNHHCRLIPS